MTQRQRGDGQIIQYIGRTHRERQQIQRRAGLPRRTSRIASSRP